MSESNTKESVVTDDCGPAFPVQLQNPASSAPKVSSGMTIRDYFAAKALQGVLSANTHWSSEDSQHVAFLAYAFADAMLAARKQPK